jgi:hypothetical protein
MSDATDPQPVSPSDNQSRRGLTVIAPRVIRAFGTASLAS